MKLSVGVEYAIHCLIYMVELEEGTCIGVHDLADFQGISESYLSKTFAKLTKAKIVKSMSGVRGGYALARDAKTISFWDVIEAIEGTDPFFRCQEIRCHNKFLDKDNLPPDYTKSPCLISEVMHEGENQMKKYLEQKTIYWLFDQVFNHQFTQEKRKKTIEWFQSHSW